MKKYLADPSPVLRAMAVAAAIPSAWREPIDNPIGYDVYAGEKMRSTHNYTELDPAKVPKVVELPVETLEKLLKDDDGAVRMSVAFLMAMEGGDQGIPVLLRYMKSDPSRREAALALLYAVLLAWSDELTPQLAEAVKAAQHNRGGYELRRAWPFIKKLPGTEIKALRAKIKNEIPELKE